ncbi:MAG TPA: general stress protein CsbD [Burkholderiales bacterium]|nr:general stress protein CsbD [Burkholderiales bacterium]
MNWSSIESGWNDFQASAKQQWSKLSDDQIAGTMGKRERLSSRVQEAYSLSKEDAERQISDWQSKQVEKQAPAANR